MPKLISVNSLAVTGASFMAGSHVAMMLDHGDNSAGMFGAVLFMVGCVLTAYTHEEDE